MTTLIEDLQAVLNPLVAGGSHYGANEAQQPTYPYVVFQRIISSANVSLTDGPSDLQNTRVQVDILSKSVSELVALEQAVDDAMLAAAFTSIPVSSLNVYEAEIRAHRSIRDFSIWATN
jgi:hypothetical protein